MCDLVPISPLTNKNETDNRRMTNMGPVLDLHRGSILTDMEGAQLPRKKGLKKPSKHNYKGGS